MDHGVLGDHFQGLAIALGVRIAHDVHRVVERGVAGQKFLKPLDGPLGERGHGQPGAVRRVRREDARPAGVGDHGQVRAARQGLGGKGLGQVEKRGHVAHPDDPGLVERGGVGLVGPGNGPGVRGRGLGARRRGSRLDHDDRLVQAGLARLTQKRVAVLHVLDVAEDDLGLLVIVEVAEHVRLVEHGLVAQGDELGKADVLTQGPVQNGHTQRTGLRKERQWNRARADRPRRMRSPLRPVFIMPRQLGPSRAIPDRSHSSMISCSRSIAFLAHFLEPGGDDDGGFAVDPRQRLQRRHHILAWHRDNGQVEPARQVGHVVDHGQPFDLRGSWDSRDNSLPAKPRAEHVCEDGMPDLAGRGGSPDDRHGLGMEKSVQIVLGAQVGSCAWWISGNVRKSLPRMGGGNKGEIDQVVSHSRASASEWNMRNLMELLRKVVSRKRHDCSTGSVQSTA